MNVRSLERTLVVAPLVLLACGREPPPVQPYVRPAPRANADVTCASLAREEGAKWSDEKVSVRVAKGPLAIGDPSIVAGPFAPPIRVDAPAGELPVRVLLGRTRAGDSHPLCVEIRLRNGDPKSFRALGDVAIDTDMLAIVDEPTYAAHVAHLGAPLFAGIDADADQLPALSKALADRGMPVERVFATYLRATRPIAVNDRQLVKDALASINADGHFVVEPASPAWSFVRALGEKPFASLDVGDSRAIVVESTNGDGAYVVAVGEGEGGPVTVEVRLAPLRSANFFSTTFWPL